MGQSRLRWCCRQAFPIVIYSTWWHLPSKNLVKLKINCNFCIWLQSGINLLLPKLIWGLWDTDCLSGGFWVPPEWPNISKSQFLRNGHVLRFQKCWFFKNKSPCGVAPNKECAFQNRPPMNYFIFTIISNSDLYPKPFFGKHKSIYKWSLTEHQHGPRGPYEHVLQDGSSHVWFKRLFFLGRLNMWVFKQIRNSGVGPRIDFWGWFQDQNDF